MNLEQLSSPLPKPWLEISADKITCRELIVAGGAIGGASFSARGTTVNQIIPGGSTLSNICTVETVSSPYFDLPTNTFTAPRDMVMAFTLSISMTTTALQNMAFTLNMSLNGVFTDELAWVFNIGSVPLGSRYPTSNTVVVAMSAGDTVSYILGNTIGALQYSAPQFSGFPVG